MSAPRGPRHQTRDPKLPPTALQRGARLTGIQGQPSSRRRPARTAVGHRTRLSVAVPRIRISHNSPLLKPRAGTEGWPCHIRQRPKCPIAAPSLHNAKIRPRPECRGHRVRLSRPRPRGPTVTAKVPATLRRMISGAEQPGSTRAPTRRPVSVRTRRELRRMPQHVWHDMSRRMPRRRCAPCRPTLQRRGRTPGKTLCTWVGSSLSLRASKLARPGRNRTQYPLGPPLRRQQKANRLFPTHCARSRWLRMSKAHLQQRTFH